MLTTFKSKIETAISIPNFFFFFLQLFLSLTSLPFEKALFNPNSIVQRGCDLSLLPLVSNPAISEVATKEPDHCKQKEKAFLPIISTSILSAKKATSKGQSL